MPDLMSKPEPSELVKVSPYLTGLLELLPAAEVERHARGAQRLKEAYSSTPFYAKAAEGDPDYWNVFYASRVNW